MFCFLNNCAIFYIVIFCINSCIANLASAFGTMLLPIQDGSACRKLLLINIQLSTAADCCED